MFVIPSLRAALRRRWPSMTSPSLRARHGILNPNSRILPHIRSTAASFLRGLPAGAASKGERFDIAGALLLALGLTAMLLGINAAKVLGTGDTIIGGAGTETLSSSGSNNTLIAGTGLDTLSSSGTGDVLESNAGGNTLTLGLGFVRR